MIDLAFWIAARNVLSSEQQEVERHCSAQSRAKQCYCQVRHRRLVVGKSAIAAHVGGGGARRGEVDKLCPKKACVPLANMQGQGEVKGEHRED